MVRSGNRECKQRFAKCKLAAAPPQELPIRKSVRMPVRKEWHTKHLVLCISVTILVTIMWPLRMLPIHIGIARKIDDEAAGSIVKQKAMTSISPLMSSGHRRTKAHFCKEPYCEGGDCNSTGYKILRNEFGFDLVDATMEKDWDLIFGGYIYCGERIRKGYYKGVYDTKMKTGLNSVLNERGWSNLKPHQVWFPCMGCKASYCNKRELCRLLRSFDPDSCYVLPEDLKKLVSAMDGKRPWVLKRDSLTEHIHAGGGVSYIRTPDDLFRRRKLKQKNLIVRPYHEPFLGTGIYKRKSELQIYLAVTSTSPLRVYAYEPEVMILAATEYKRHADIMHDKCMIDAHMKEKCPATNFIRRITFQEYADKVNFSGTEQKQLIESALSMLSAVIQGGHPTVQRHKINQGIQESGAMCFSYMRADLGITAKKQPVLFEINELPDKTGTGYNRSDASYRIREDSLRDLFYMIGLDQVPIPVEKRAEYEAGHLGGWRLLPNLVT